MANAVGGLLIPTHAVSIPKAWPQGAVARIGSAGLPTMPNGPALALFDDPPERMEVPDRPGQPWLDRRKRQVDFVRRDAQNRKLGRLGEQFVLDLERRRLTDRGRDDLAHRVEWVPVQAGQSNRRTRRDGLPTPA